MSVLEEFYYGNIIPHEIPIDNGSDYANVNKLIIRYDEILTSTLTEKQKELFIKYKDHSIELLPSGNVMRLSEGFLLASNSCQKQ